MSWKWSGGQPSGVAAEVKADTLTITSDKGNEIKRKGDEENPAVRIEREGNDVVKKASELVVEEKGEGGEKEEVNGAEEGEKETDTGKEETAHEEGSKLVNRGDANGHQETRDTEAEDKVNGEAQVSKDVEMADTDEAPEETAEDKQTEDPKEAEETESEELTPEKAEESETQEEPVDDESHATAGTKRKVDEGGEEQPQDDDDAKKQKTTDGSVKRGRGRPAKSESNGDGSKKTAPKKHAAEPTPGTRRSTRSTKKV